MPFLPADLNEDRYRDIVASLSVWNAHLLVAVPLALFLGRKLSGWKDKAVLCWFVHYSFLLLVKNGDSFCSLSFFFFLGLCMMPSFTPYWREAFCGCPLEELWPRTKQTHSLLYGENMRTLIKRWAVADPTVVSIEILTVVVCTFLCILLIDAVVNKRPTRHFYQVTLSVMELYGGWMTFCPEWLSGSQSLDTSNTLYLWVYLWLANGLWVIIPLLLLWQSAVEMHRAFSVVGEKEEERRGGKRERQQKLKKIN